MSRRFEELQSRLRPGIPRARLDPEGTARGKTELRGVRLPSSRCHLDGSTVGVSPGVMHVDLETGLSTLLYGLEKH